MSDPERRSGHRGAAGGGAGEPPTDVPRPGPDPRQAPPGWGGGGMRGPGRPARSGSDPRVALFLIVAAALVAILVRTGHIDAVEVTAFCVVVPSIILHEVSHGWVASLCGDDTARRAGRLTLNPLPHIDVLGTIILPVIMTLSGIGAFGWAKPVPVDVSKLRHPRNQAVLVALMGPAVNIVLALAAAIAYREVVPLPDKAAVAFSGNLSAQPEWALILFLVGYVNVILAVFNLIPLPPLDGSAVLERLLPTSWLPAYYRIRPYTLILPLGLVVISSFGSGGSNLLGDIFGPALNWWARLVGI